MHTAYYQEDGMTCFIMLNNIFEQTKDLVLKGIARIHQIPEMQPMQFLYLCKLHH